MKGDILHLEKDEHVIMEVRKHWIVFLGHVLGFLFSAILPLIILTLVRMYVPGVFNIDFRGNPYALFTFVYSLWLLIVWVFFFIDWTKYYLDVWYVTEKRIIAVDQRHIFDRGVSNLYMDRIQDVTINTRGIIATFLNFGDVRVQTAGEDNEVFYMHTIGRPDVFKKVIFSQRGNSN